MRGPIHAKGQRIIFNATKTSITLNKKDDNNDYYFNFAERNL